MAKQTTIQLYDPFPHQMALHQLVGDHLSKCPPGDPGRQTIIDINAMRQVGKSTCICNELGRFGFEMPKCESIYIAPTFELAKKMLADFIKALAGTALVKSINKSDRQILLCNDHLLRFLSAEQGDNIRGLNVSGLLVIDEFAYIRQSFMEEVVYPFTDFHKAPTICISTPRTKQGLHWEYQCLGKIPDSGIIAIDWADYDISYLHTPEWIEQKRQLYTERAFQTEILGKFLDNDSAVFGDLKPVIMPKGYTPSAKKLYWGIDWATGASKDRTVLTAYNQNNEQFSINVWASESPMQQVREIANILNSHKEITERVVAEKNSMGAVYIDALREAVSNIPITEFVTTNESKRKIIDGLVLLIEKAEIKLLNDPSQLAEFEFFEANTLPSGLITYSAPSSLHDDYVMASAIALSGRNVVNRWF